MWSVCLLTATLLNMPSPLEAQPSRHLNQPTSSQQRFLSPLLPPDELSIRAKSAVLIDGVTGEVLVAHNPNLQIPPASFVKLLTLYVVFDAIKQGKARLDETVLISKKAWKTGGSKMFIEVGTKLSVQELIQGIAVVSGNDAAVAMAEHLYGDADTFTRVLNRYAQRLGMTHSFFANPHGLPTQKQWTTAHDMARLARSYVNHFPEALRYHSMQTYTYQGITQRNRNRLLQHDDLEVDGLKTGWVVESGYNLVATSHRDGHRLISVVMGAQTAAIRAQETLKLLKYGYQNFALLTLAEPGQVVAELPVWKGVTDRLAIMTPERSVIVLPREHIGRIQQVQVLPKALTAPVEKGQVLGKLIITDGADQLRSIALVAGAQMPAAGWFKRLWHHVYLHGLSTTQLLLLILVGVLGVVFLATLIMMAKRRRRRRPSLQSLLAPHRPMRGRAFRSRLAR